MSFDPAKEQEKNAQAVLKKAIEEGKAAQLLDALVSGGYYAHNRFSGELTIHRHSEWQDEPRDAYCIVLTEHTAKVFSSVGETEVVSALKRAVETIIYDAKGLTLLVHPKPVSTVIHGMEHDEIDDTVSSGPVAIVMRTHWAEEHQRRLMLDAQFGVPVAGAQDES